MKNLTIPPKEKNPGSTTRISILKSNEERPSWREFIRVYLQKSRDPRFKAHGTRRKAEFIVKDLKAMGIDYSEYTARVILGKRIFFNVYESPVPDVF